MEVFVGSFPYRVAAAKGCLGWHLSRTQQSIQRTYPVVTDTSTMYVYMVESISYAPKQSTRDGRVCINLTLFVSSRARGQRDGMLVKCVCSIGLQRPTFNIHVENNYTIHTDTAFTLVYLSCLSLVVLPS